MKKIILLALCFLVLKTHAQKTSLKVGDNMPDLEFNNLINSTKDKSIRISGLKGKLIILDFWTTSCSSCIAGWPKLRAIQDQFKDNLQILLVSSARSESRAKLESFFALRKKKGIENYNLPSIVEDSILVNYFPHRSVPHLVWIDGNGKIISISDGGYVTEQNVKLALEGKLSLPIKREVLDFTYKKPLLIDENGSQQDNFLYRSLFTKRIEGLPGAVSRRGTEETSRLTFTNYLINELYKYAYREDIDIYDNDFNVDIKVKDSTFLKVPKKIEELHKWAPDNIFCYELITPKSMKNSMPEIMRNDLDNFFGFNSQVIEREMKLFSLIKLSGPDKISTKGDICISYRKNEKKGEYFYAQNSAIDLLINKINSWGNFSQIIDETHQKSNIDIKVKWNIKTIAELKEELNKYGLDVIEKTYKIKCLVIRDKLAEPNIGAFNN